MSILVVKQFLSHLDIWIYGGQFRVVFGPAVSSLLSFWRYNAGDRDVGARQGKSRFTALPDGCVEFVNQGRLEAAGRWLDELAGSGW